MRYLSKIVFINSAHVHYADVALDGNVHFIGTQGVGKSTLLRAILFFYNADKNSLGIGREQKSFDEFYLPSPDSYIIYEVQRENGPFFVVVLKSQGRAAFRLVDCAYDKRFFVEEGGQVRHEWGKISLAIGSKAKHSRLIRSYHEFRDIIYGNVQALDKELRRYHLMESAKYQNVPRTIQNIFLNQSLESRVIKDTIISSMDFASDSINLDYFRTKAKEFRQEYEDTWKWFKKEKNGHIKVVDDANRVGQCHADYLMTVRSIAELYAWLLFAVHRDQDLLPVLERKEQDATTNLERQQRLLSEESGKYNAERDKHNREIGQLEATLRRTKERRDHWAKSEIERIKRLMGQQDALRVEHETLRSEYETLTRGSSDIKAKYDLLIAAAEQKLSRLLSSLHEQKLNVEGEYREKKDHLTEQLMAKKAQLAEQHRKDEAQLAEKRDQEVHRLAGLESQYTKVEVLNPFQEKMQAVEERINALNGKQHQLEVRQRDLTLREEKIKSQAEAERRQLEVEHDKAVAQLSQERAEVCKALEALQTLLDQQEGSLISWLSQNVDDWENTLGRVLDEEHVLYNTQLSPQLTATGDTTLMGVSLDLSQVERTVRTPEQLQQEKTKLEGELDTLKQRRVTLQQQLEADIQRISRKPNADLRALRQEKVAANAELAALPKQIETQQTSLHTLKDQLDDWRKKQREEIKREQDKANALLADILRQSGALAERRRREEREAEREQKNKLQTVEKAKDDALAEIGEQKKRYEADLAKQRNELTMQMDKELQGMGIDQKKLQSLRQQIGKTETDLNYIEQHREDYFNWQRDCRDYFDKEENNRLLLRQERQAVDDLQRRFSEREQRLKGAIALLQKEKREAADSQQRLTEQLRRANDFLQANASQLPGTDETNEEKTLEAIPDLLDRLRDDISNRQQRMNRFKQSVDSFKNNFSAQNTFHFPTDLHTDADYEDFAANLHEFVGMRKMDYYRTRTSQLYANITQRIAREVNDLMNHNSMVQKTIADINHDFLDNNFVGVIKDIQLRAEPSNDRLMQLLLKIQAFANEAQMDMGEINLFSDEQQRSANNQKAIDLIMTLIDILDAEAKRDRVTLADTFKLEFKVKENDNDTSWVEKLSNVGSDGTDILVKAMVNIMLINVFKRKVSKKSGDFRLHCMMDEIGKLHPNNVEGILKFANDRNILLINSSPTTYNASAYRHTYMLSKDAQSNTIVKSLLTIR